MSQDKKLTTIFQAMRAAGAAMTTARRGAKDLIEGLSFLQEKSGEKFSFREKTTYDGSVLLETTDLRVNVRNYTEPLRLTVDTNGDITGNMQAEEGAEEPAAEAADARLETAMSAHQAGLDKAKQEPALLSMERALTDIAYRATLHDHISSADIGDTVPAGAGVRAVVAGIREAEEECLLAERQAADFAEGLSFLEKLSQGSLECGAHRLNNSSDMALAITSRLEHKERFPAVHLKITALGKVTQSNNSSHMGGFTVDLLAEEDNRLKLLTDIAKTAVFAGHIPLAPDTFSAKDLLLAGVQGVQTACESSPVKQAVRDAVDEAAAQVALAQSAATELAAGLVFLQRRSGRRLAVEKAQIGPNFCFKVRLKNPSSLQIMITPEGEMTVGTDTKKLNAWKDADVAAVLADITTRATFQGLGPHRKATRAQGPAKRF